MKLWLELQEKMGFPEKIKKKQMENMQNALKEDEGNLITIWEYITWEYRKQQNIGTIDDKPNRPPLGKKLEYTYRNSYFVDLS